MLAVSLPNTGTLKYVPTGGSWSGRLFQNLSARSSFGNSASRGRRVISIRHLIPDGSDGGRWLERKEKRGTRGRAKREKSAGCSACSAVAHRIPALVRRRRHCSACRTSNAVYIMQRTDGHAGATHEKGQLRLCGCSTRRTQPTRPRSQPRLPSSVGSRPLPAATTHSPAAPAASR